MKNENRKITCLIWLFAVGSSAGFYSLGILLLFFCVLSYKACCRYGQPGPICCFLFSLSAVCNDGIQFLRTVFEYHL